MSLFSLSASARSASLCSLSASLLLCACQTYEKTPEGGRFHGEARMVPVTPNTFFFYRPQDKDDVLFSYEPGEKSPFRDRFSGNRITPDAMLTTGASVPRSLWMAPGLSPFDYTGAALIHDWLFEAHHRHQIGTWLTQYGKDQSARDKGARLVRDYAEYADLTQDEAADIYAECIRAIMDQNARLKQDLTVLMDRNGNPLSHDRLVELRDSLKPVRKSSFWLWAHRWFTSEDCLIPTARKKWEAQHDDLGLYEALAKRETAVEKGYMSAWLRKKFRRIYEEPARRATADDGRLAGVNASVEASTALLREKEHAGTLRPRIYLEVEDSQSQSILRSRAAAFPGMDVLPDKHFSRMNPGTLTIYYYEAADKAGADEILHALARMMPGGALPPGARVVKLNDGGLFRPKHYDLHISRDVARSLAPTS
ncbi:MAG: DUF1353 domain-containing protein [Verrucomicrobiaceae bacterium]|nr:DUF1353 domain-containing protein [Verrucomicrobiaceae bacterium]